MDNTGRFPPLGPGFFFSSSVNSLVGYIISKVLLKSASDFGRQWVSPYFIGYPLAPFMSSEPGSYGDSPPGLGLSGPLRSFVGLP